METEVNHKLPLAKALFLLFADGRKEASAIGQEWLWVDRCPQSWMALFKMRAPCFVRWPQLEPVASCTFLYTNCAVIYGAHIVNMTCSACRRSSIGKSY